MSSSESPLATGWEPEAPPEDTLVRRAILAHAAWVEAEARLTGRPVGRSARLAVNWIGDRGVFTNQALALQPITDIASVMAEIETTCPPTAPCCLFSPWPTGDLTRFGFELMGHPPLMVRWPYGAAAAEPGPLATGDIREIHTADDLADLERVLVEGFSLPGLEPFEVGCVFPASVLGDVLRFWLVRYEGRPVAGAVGCTAAGMNLVEFVATVPDARGRGHGACATMAATRADPSLPAVLISSDDGRPVYERLGFVAIERWTVWARGTGS